MRYRVRVYCIGSSPLLINAVQDELLEERRTGKKSAKLKDRSREAEAKDKLYLVDGIPGIPADNLFSCLVEAGRRIPYEKKSNISTAISSSLPWVLSIEEDFLFFPPEWRKWHPNVKRGVNPNGGEMVAICRPLFSKWGFCCTVVLEDKPVVEKTFRQLFDLAGRIGLCDFRPARRGRYGCFKVIQWENLGVIEEEAEDYHEDLEILERFQKKMAA